LAVLVLAAVCAVWCGRSGPRGLSQEARERITMSVEQFRTLALQGEDAECSRMIEVATEPALLDLYARNTAPGAPLPHPILLLECCERLKALGTPEAIEALVGLIEVPTDGESGYNWSMVVRDAGDEAVPYLERYRDGDEGETAAMLLDDIHKGIGGFERGD